MCPQKTGSRVKRALARDDAVCSLVTLVSWLSFHHSTFKYLRFLSAAICVNHLSTFKYPVDPVDPVIRVL